MYFPLRTNSLYKLQSNIVLSKCLRHLSTITPLTILVPSVKLYNFIVLYFTVFATKCDPVKSLLSSVRCNPNYVVVVIHRSESYSCYLVWKSSDLSISRQDFLLHGFKISNDPHLKFYSAVCGCVLSLRPSRIREAFFGEDGPFQNWKTCSLSDSDLLWKEFQPVVT